MTLPIPRKLDSASASTVSELARKVFTFASDVVNYLIARDAELDTEIDEIDARLTVVEAIEHDVHELGPNTETLTGDTYDGVATYRCRWSGSSLGSGSTTLVASGIASIVQSGGWATFDGGNKHAFPFQIDSTNARASPHVTSGGALVVFAGSQCDNNPYDFWIEYTKV